MHDFERGYDFVLRQGGGHLGAEVGVNYIRDVQAAIDELYRRMNAYDYYQATRPAQESLKGFLAEEYAAGTANIDAAVKGSDVRFEVLHSHDLGSVDVAGPGTAYQLKIYESPYQTVRALGTTLFDRYKASADSAMMGFDEWAALKGRPGASPSDLLYEGQFGLVAPDKLEDCRQEAFKLLAKSKALGKDAEVQRWKKVADGLVDRVRGEDGVEGRALTVDEARKKAIEVSSGRHLDSADDGMTPAQLVETQHLLRQSLKAGATAAAVSAALKVAPEIYRAIDKLITEGELSEEDIRTIGAATLDGGTTGFINGSASAAITAAAAKGMFGQGIMRAASRSMGPAVIGTLVVLTVETCKDAFLVANGQKTQKELMDGFTQGAFVSAISLVGAGVASVVSGGAAIPMLIGSLVGSAAGGLAFSPAKSLVLSLANESGFTFFGLVRQSYELPEGTKDRLGIKKASVKSANLASADVRLGRTRTASVKHASPHTISISYDRRGIVGVDKIGYMPS